MPAYRHLFRSVTKKLFTYVSNGGNGKLMYEMLNKECVINEIFSEKGKKDHQLFGGLGSKIFVKFGNQKLKIISAPYV